LIFPLNINRKPVAFICFWQYQDKNYSKEDLKDIKSLSKMLENKLSKAVGYEFEQIFRNGEISSNRLQSHHSGNTIEEKIQSIFNHVKSQMSLDYMSLVVKKVNDNFHKYSMSDSGYVLKEINADFFTTPGVSGYVYKNNFPVIIDDLGQETDFIVEPAVMKNDMRSMAVLPLGDKDNLLGVITFATKEASSYKGISRLLIEKSLSSFKDIIFDQQYHNDIAEQLERLNKIEKFALTASGNIEPEELIKKATDLLAGEIHPSMIRYSNNSNEEQFLYSHTLNTVIPYDRMMPDDGIMIKSLMPNHQIVIDQKKTLHVTGNGSNSIPESEAVQIFGRKVNSMVIVPVVLNSKLFGLISMAELRNHDRYAFTLTDIKLAESIARILAQGLTRYEQLKELKLNSESKPQKELNVKIRSSLAGILNSVELLKDNDRKDPRTVEACISILDRSAKDINESLVQNLDNK
jgi:transcriptional regulator with GAF, ATPase, and Fis domain